MVKMLKGISARKLLFPQLKKKAMGGHLEPNVFVAQFQKTQKLKLGSISKLFLQVPYGGDLLQDFAQNDKSPESV